MLLHLCVSVLIAWFMVSHLQAINYNWNNFHSQQEIGCPLDLQSVPCLYSQLPKTRARHGIPEEYLETGGYLSWALSGFFFPPNNSLCAALQMVMDSSLSQQPQIIKIRLCSQSSVRLCQHVLEVVGMLWKILFFPKWRVRLRTKKCVVSSTLSDRAALTHWEVWNLSQNHTKLSLVSHSGAQLVTVISVSINRVDQIFWKEGCLFSLHRRLLLSSYTEHCIFSLIGTRHRAMPNYRQAWSLIWQDLMQEYRKQ